MDKSVDDLMGWLHKMATKSDAQIASQLNRANQELLNRVVALCANNQAVPDDLSGSEFVDWIRGLRSSERDWNRALGTSLVRAEDALSNGDRAGAVALLQEFATKCPWLALRAIAENEASRYSAGP